MGKGGGKQKTPYEAPNDLSSKQKLSIIDLVSEGPIEGPINDLQGVLLNDTPVIDASDNSSVNGLTAQWVSGTLEQPALEGFTSSASETAVSVEIKKNGPITRTITSRNIDRLRLTFGTQSLVESRDNGDRAPTSVELQIQLQRNGQWVTEKNITITGKRSNSPYLTAAIIDKLPPPPFGVRMVRITPDSTSDRLQNSTIWSSYTELTDITQTYPGSAVAGLTFESEQFGNQFPRRNYLIRGRIVQVPDNYDPEALTYKGIWTGKFKPAYTNNPAWILWDLLTHPRYGMGTRLKIQEVDKFVLYAIGQYCDQWVPDGFGGKEPRMRCNAYITDMRKIYDVISDLCSLMRTMPVWNGQKMTFIQDRPSDSVWPYTNANVINGEFQYSFSGSKARHNAIEVRFIDPDNGWKTSVELVSDDAHIALHGRNVLRVDAFGCTSRGQAHRHGLWILMTEKLETQTAEFAIGAEGLRHVPGDIIEIADNNYIQGQAGGRIVSFDATTQVLTLDRDVEIPKSGKSQLTLLDQNGSPQTHEITRYISSSQIEVKALQTVIENGVWAIALPSLRRRLFRAISVADNGDNTYAIIAVQHVPEKEAIVDQGVKFEPLPEVPTNSYIPAVEYLSVDIAQDNEAWQAEANWNAPSTGRGIEFLLKLTFADRIVGSATTQEASYRFSGLPQGNYKLTVTPQNDKGQKGEPASVDFDVNPPAPPSYIDVEPGFFSLGIIPRSSGQNALRMQYEFWFAEKRITNINEVESLSQYLGNGTMWVIQGKQLKAGQLYYIYVRSVNAVGKSVFVEASGKPDDRADEILAIAGDHFLSTEAGKQLEEKIDLNMEKVVELESDGFLYEDIIAQHNTQLKRLDRASIEHSEQFGEIIFNALAEKGDRRAEIKRVDGVIANEKEARAKSTELLTAEIGKNSAEIFSMKEVYVNDEKSRALQQQQIESKFKFNDSAILEIRETTSTLESSYAEQKLQLESVTQRIDKTDETVKESSARITEAQKTATDAKNAQTEYQKISESKFDEHQSSIAQSQQTANSVHSAVAKLSTELSAESARQNENINQANASLKRQDTVIATQTEALTQTKVELTAQLNENKAYIGRIDTALATETTARTTAETQMKAEIGANKAAITRIEKTVVDNEQSFSQSITQLNSQYEIANSSITELSKTVTDNKKAQAEENKLIKAELGENAAAIEQRAQTVFDHEGNGSAIYSIKTGINYKGQYYDAKFMMGVEVKNGKVVTQIGFSADTFGIFNPANGKLEPVFFAENGQVFINSAFINSATIEKIVVGLDMRSKNYDPSKRTGTRIDMENGVIEIYGSDGQGGMVQKNNEISMYDENGKLCLFIGLWKGGNFGS